ncbi:MAG: hypothetical protein GXP49_13635 [Deltaproteobacteria bacterium]|nr:hypothetical protein [Deltaproteobacteria bacterium]
MMKVSRGDKGRARDRDILSCMLESAVRVEDLKDLSYAGFMLEPGPLEKALVKRMGFSRGRAAKAARSIGHNLRLRIWKNEPIEVKLGGRVLRINRSLVAEALGALASDLLPTRRRAIQESMAAAREVLYFGGDGKNPLPVLASPSVLVDMAGKGEDLSASGKELFLEDAPLWNKNWTVRELLERDRSIQKSFGSEDDIKSFQEKLREDVLDGATVMKLREFYSRKITVGFRDTMRWALGSRHPWFGWNRARDLIEHSFKEHGSESFLPSFLRIYTYDLDLEESEIKTILESNTKVVYRLAGLIKPQLIARTREALSDGRLERLCAVCLDYHHDYPDYEIEARGRIPGGVSAGFAAKAAADVLRKMLGMELEPRRNTNVGVYCRSIGIEQELLGGLEESEKKDIYRIIEETLSGTSGPAAEYVRPKMILYTLFQSPVPRARPGEKLVDSFTLADAKVPRHSVHMVKNVALLEKLVVFFTLVVRHYLDTGYVPDLMPADKMKDFTLLGLWGHNTRSLRINLYESDGNGDRTEIVFTGKGQIRRYRPDEEGISEAAVAKMIVSHLDPLIEPSVLRALAGFLMALDEHLRGNRARGLERLSVARHAVEVYREGMRRGLKATMVDMATLLEVLVNDSADMAQDGLNRLEKLLSSH